MVKRKYKDPLDQQGIGAEYLGNFSQKLEYDPTFGRNFYTAMYLVLAVVAVVIGVVFKSVLFYYIAAACGVFALLTLLLYKTWKGYDIASSRVYCEKLYPPGTSKAKIRECLYEREREERIRYGGAGSSIGNALFAGATAYTLSRW